MVDGNGLVCQLFIQYSCQGADTNFGDSVSIIGPSALDMMPVLGTSHKFFHQFVKCFYSQAESRLGKLFPQCCSMGLFSIDFRLQQQ